MVGRRARHPDGGLDATNGANPVGSSSAREVRTRTRATERFEKFVPWSGILLKAGELFCLIVVAQAAPVLIFWPPQAVKIRS